MNLNAQSTDLPIHIIAVGDFGNAVATALTALRSDVIVTRPAADGTVSPAYWPVSRVLVLATWRPAPTLSQMCENASFAWRIGFIPVVAEAPVVRVGPAIVPGKGGCLTCYEKRVLQHSMRATLLSALHAYYDANPQAGPQGYLSVFADIVAARVAYVIDQMAKAPDNVAGQLWQLNTINRHIGTARTVGIHGCPRCGLHRDEATRSVTAMRQALDWLYSPARTLEQRYGLDMSEVIVEQHELAERVGLTSHNGNGRHS